MVSLDSKKNFTDRRETVMCRCCVMTKRGGCVYAYGHSFGRKCHLMWWVRQNPVQTPSWTVEVNRFVRGSLVPKCKFRFGLEFEHAACKQEMHFPRVCFFLFVALAWVVWGVMGGGAPLVGRLAEPLSGLLIHLWTPLDTQHPTLTNGSKKLQHM